MESKDIIENLHVFEGSMGHYSNLSYNTFQRIQPALNKVVCLAKTKTKQIDCIDCVESDEQFFQLFDDFNFHRVFFHSLSFKTGRLLKRIKEIEPEIKIVWIFWSGEFYALPDKVNSLYLPDSLPFVRKDKIKTAILAIKQFAARLLLGRDRFSKAELLHRYSYVDFLCTTFYGDYQNVLFYAKGLKIQWLPYSYLSIEDIVRDVPASTANSACNDAETIMIGHSSSPSNNHIEILNKISQWRISNSVYIPLAYGDERYKEFIKQLICNRLQSFNIELQEELLPLPQYYSKLLNVRYAVLNTTIQRGFGNVVPLLWMGVKVFLREESAMYISFKEAGLYIYSIQSEFTPLNLYPLTDDEMRQNRKKLLELFSRKIVDNQILAVLTI